MCGDRLPSQSRPRRSKRHAFKWRTSSAEEGPALLPDLQEPRQRVDDDVGLGRLGQDLATQAFRHDAVVARLAGVEQKGYAARDQLTRNWRDAVGPDTDINDGGIETFDLGPTERFLNRAAGAHAVRTCLAQDSFEIQ